MYVCISVSVCKLLPFVDQSVLYDYICLKLKVQHYENYLKHYEYHNFVNIFENNKYTQFRNKQNIHNYKFKS